MKLLRQVREQREELERWQEFYGVMKPREARAAIGVTLPMKRGWRRGSGLGSANSRVLGGAVRGATAEPGGGGETEQRA